MINKNKKLIMLSILCLSITVLSIIYFMFFHQMGSNNENGKLYLELLPAMIGDTQGYEATIKNEKNKKVVSKKLFYVHGQPDENESSYYTYGKWEIKSYKFQYERTKEGSSFFIYSSSYTRIRLHLYVDVISEGLDFIKLEITNPIEIMKKGDEYTFKSERYPVKGTKLTWDVINKDDKNELEVIKVNHNPSSGGRAVVSNNEATISALECGTTYLELDLYKDGIFVTFKEYKITVVD